MNIKKNLTLLLPLIFVNVVLLSTPVQGAMNDYCVTPPFLAQSIPPNVLIVLDNSLSMACEAYANSYDPTQFANGKYFGYFDPAKNYQYTNNGRWEETAAATTSATVANPIASGDFLNWATMRRVEVAKKLLVGGKGNPRSPSAGQTVKLDGEGTQSYCNSFDKDYDNTSQPGLIYPFTGNYRYTRRADELTVAPVNPAIDTETLRPAGNLATGAWTVFPSTTQASDDVDDTGTGDGDGTYIQNTISNTNDHILFRSGTYTPAITGTITNVTVFIRAKKAGSSTSATRRIQAVLRVKNNASIDVDSFSSYSNLTTNYAIYQFSWPTNPQTGISWTWNDLTTNGVNSLSGFGVKAYTQPTSSNYPRVTQIYFVVTVSNPAGGPYKIIVDHGNTAARGIIDTLTGDVRFGLAYYAGANKNGAKINTYIDFGTPTNMITSLENMNPETYTPLGESLYEMTRYFRQDAPAYSNSPADFSIGSNGSANLVRDPYWYRYSAFGLADRYVPCAKSFVLFLTDGESTMDGDSIPGSSTSAPYASCSSTNIKGCSGYGGSPSNPNPRFAGTGIGTTYGLNGTDHMIDVAYWARTNDMRPGSCTAIPSDSTAWQQCVPGIQNITLYNVFMFGSGLSLLKDASIYGGFNDLNANNKPDCSTIPAECYKDSDGDGVVESNGQDNPLTYYEGEDGYALQASIIKAIADILARVTSGTAASVLASGEGSGANLVQATYYPKRQFGNDAISWIGSLQNLWYYVDPFYGKSNIREEGGTTKDYILDLKADGSSNAYKDYILQLYFDTTDQKAKAKRFHDTAGNGTLGSQVDTIEFQNLGNLWNTGKLLWSRNLSSSPRTIKTWFDKNDNNILEADEYLDFTAAAFNSLSATDKAEFRQDLQALDDLEASKTISYVHGFDKFCTGTATPCSLDADCTSPATCSGAGIRSRTVAIDMNGDGDVLDAGESAKVWKLGDIINSTPQIASWMPLNLYDKAYGDATYKAFTEDTGSSLPADSTARYKNKGMVFVGGNDGMLHAFKLGKLGLYWSGQTQSQKATLGKYCSTSPGTACGADSDCVSGSCILDTELGKEIWAFVPKNVLPYLKYTADPSYCHVYSVDLAPFIFDASIEGPSTTCPEANYWNCPKNVDSWRTILIGGMRYGGGCKDTTYAGTQGVKVPAPGEGYSSYFALDITDPYNPQLLWEFSHPELGFATSGGTVVRINARTSDPASSADSTRDGRWFVVFGSGPTGGIDTSDNQFMGNSDQTLKLFILDLKDGSLVRQPINTGIQNAFAGSLLNGAHDSDLDYQDDIVYIPYVRQCATGDTSAICNSSQGKWNNGGVLRLLTNEDLAGSVSGGGTALTPDNWVATKVIDDTGPVTASVVRVQNKNPGKLWLYFGTGRYFYKMSTSIDDSDNVRHLYGLKDPCFTSGAFLSQCLSGTEMSYTPSQLAAIDLTLPAGVNDDQGWKISLDGCTNAAGTQVTCTGADAYFKPERVITNPVATSTGLVFFTTLKPYDDICTSGGNTAIWGVKYDSGAAAGALLQGMALVQVSTGAIEQMNLATSFTQKGSRKTADISGLPPMAQGLSIMSSPNPIKRVIHLRER